MWQFCSGYGPLQEASVVFFQKGNNLVLFSFVEDKSGSIILDFVVGSVKMMEGQRG